MPTNKVSGYENTMPQFPTYVNIHDGQMFTMVNSATIYFKTDDDRFVNLKTGALEYGLEDNEPINIVPKGTKIIIEAG